MGDVPPGPRGPKASRPVLVVGYGSSLRGDDAVGQRVVAELQARWEGAPARARPRFVLTECLTPELAEDLARAGLALFVDAACDGRSAGEVTVHFVAVSDGAGVVGPNGEAAGGCWQDVTPEALIGLAHDLYGSAPPTLVVSVGVARTRVGQELSAPVEAAVPEAVRVAEQVLEAWESGPSRGQGPWYPAGWQAKRVAERERRTMQRYRHW